MGIVNGINQIPRYIGLDKATKAVGSWLDRHPLINKIVMVVNHIFRTLAMVALMYFLPFAAPINLAIGLAASLFYRITVERFCPFRFALSACIGAAAFELSKPFLVDIINGVAFSSFTAFAASFIGILPFAISAVAIILISNNAVDAKFKQQQAQSATDCGSCCVVPKKPPQKAACCGS